MYEKKKKLNTKNGLFSQTIRVQMFQKKTLPLRLEVLLLTNNHFHLSYMELVVGESSTKNHLR